MRKTFVVAALALVTAALPADAAEPNVMGHSTGSIGYISIWQDDGVGDHGASAGCGFRVDPVLLGEGDGVAVMIQAGAGSGGHLETDYTEVVCSLLDTDGNVVYEHENALYWKYVAFAEYTLVHAQPPFTVCVEAEGYWSDGHETELEACQPPNL
jgi:hypothetical protein